MSKRRSKKPNLPDDVLARARREAGIEASQPENQSDENDSDDEKASPVVQRTPRRRKSNPAQLERSRKRGELDAETVRYMLENPTITVTEAQLREEYQHVLFDLRNMGILAAGLMILLVLLARFI
jgi:hypothetical protein